MGLSKDAAKGSKWEKKNVVFLLEKQLNIEFKSIQGVRDLRPLYDYSSNLKRIYYYKEKNQKLEDDLSWWALFARVLGIGVVVANGKCPHDILKHVGDITNDYIAFHAFLILEFSQNNWVSLEKNDQMVCIQVGKAMEDVVKYKYGGENSDVGGFLRENTTELSVQDGNERFTIENVLEWVINSQQSEKGYNILLNNCKHFASEGAEQFSSSNLPLPGYVELLENMKTIRSGAKERSASNLEAGNIPIREEWCIKSRSRRSCLKIE